MKRHSSAQDEPKLRKGGIKWDEDNLEENERIKKELNPRKIDEPKTPYLSPQGTEDEAEMLDTAGVAPLSMDDPHMARIRISRGGSGWSDSSDQNGGSPEPGGADGSSGGRSSSRSPRFSDEYYIGDSDEDEDEEGGGGDDDAASVKREKRRKFKEARKAHYGKEAAVMKVKEVVNDEEEELRTQEMDINGGNDEENES